MKAESLFRRRRWTYPGLLAPVRIVAFVPMVIGAVVNDFTITTFGFGWWLACIVCEFAYHYLDERPAR